MENTNNQKLVKNLILTIVFLVLILILVVSFKKNGSVISNNDLSATSTIDQISTTTDNTKTNNLKTPVTVQSSTEMCNFKITYPTPYSNITFPLTIKGTISLLKKYNCEWSQNQTLGGTVQIFYNLRNSGWKSSGIPTKINTSSSVSTSTLALSAPINMYTSALGLPSGTPIKLVFTELNIENHPSPKTFSFIVYLK